MSDVLTSIIPPESHVVMSCGPDILVNKNTNKQKIDQRTLLSRYVANPQPMSAPSRSRWKPENQISVPATRLYQILDQNA